MFSKFLNMFTRKTNENILMIKLVNNLDNDKIVNEILKIL